MNSLMMRNSNVEFYAPIQQTCLEMCEELEKFLSKNSKEFIEVPDLIEFLYAWAVKGLPSNACYKYKLKYIFCLL